MLDTMVHALPEKGKTSEAAQRAALQLPPRRSKSCQKRHDLARRRRSAASAGWAAPGSGVCLRKSEAQESSLLPGLVVPPICAHQHV